MGIDYGHLRNLTDREMISALVRDGFTHDRVEGSHQISYHADRRRVTVIFHGGSRMFKRKTLETMIDQAGWAEEDLMRLRLIR